jgi:hypothetical protein
MDADDEILAPLLPELINILEQEKPRARFSHQPCKLKHQFISLVAKMGAALLFGEPLTGRSAGEQVEAAIKLLPSEEHFTCQILCPRVQASVWQVAPEGRDGALACIERHKYFETCSSQTKRKPPSATERINARVSVAHIPNSSTNLALSFSISFVSHSHTATTRHPWLTSSS